MAFVCTIHRDAPVPDHDGQQSLVVLPIGYDDVDGRIYQLFITFDTAPGGIIEYSFCIISTHTDGVSYDCWDSHVVASFIPRDARSLVLQALLDVTAMMLQVFKPASVTMHTFARDLPTKALVKNERISQVFADAGYAVRTHEHNGRHSWWFDRAA